MSRTITTGGVSLICDDPIEVWRAETMFTKEPGTVTWLNGLRSGEMFYDVGANIGVYTLLAAQKVGSEGRVFAFEPSIVNAVQLQKNLVASKLTNVKLCTAPLHSYSGLSVFAYRSLRAGSSGHQLGHRHDETGQVFIPEATEIKATTTLDQVICEFPPAQMVKIDVDGNELQILQGATTWLRTHTSIAPRSIQVESHVNDRAELLQFMDEHGYRLDHLHYTASGQKQIDQGADPATVVNNTVFVKR